MNMRYKLLGRTGLRVSELCLGTMTFGNTDWGTPEADASEMYRRFRDLGGNYVDTANEIYAEGRSEEITGRLVGGHRHDVVVATKYTFAVPGGHDPNAGGNHRKSLLRSIESSLKRLNTDYVDLLWVHAWDPATPVDEMMRALDDLVRQGKVLYVGVSNTPAWIVAQCNTLADCRGWTPFAGLQVEYSLLERAAERELLPMARRLDLSVAAWSPLGSGMLTGKYARADTEVRRLDKMDFSLRAVNDRNTAIAAGVSAVAVQLGRSPAQVALNWLRSKPGVIPLIGARTIAQIDDNLGCLGFTLSPEHLSQLDQLSAQAAGYPHDILQGTRMLVGAGFQDRLDPHRF